MGQEAWEPSPGKLSLLDVVLGTDVLGFGALVPGDEGITPQVGKQKNQKSSRPMRARWVCRVHGWEASLCVDCSWGGDGGHGPGKSAPWAQGQSEPHPHLWELCLFQEGRQS